MIPNNVPPRRALVRVETQPNEVKLVELSGAHDGHEKIEPLMLHAQAARGPRQITA